jgi:bifunctional enzyme CysN/CysC
MELLRFATAGSVDDGKSTLIGRLLYDSKAIFEDQLEAVERVSNQRGNDYTDLALLTDGLRAEREQGITIDVAYRYFATPKRKFIIADTPGHVQYTRNMVTGNSTADLTIVLVDARKGIVEQTRRHAFLASLLRVPHLVVCVNKMDLVDYDQEVFDSIRREFTSFASRLDVSDLTFIPMSALQGDNVVHRSTSMPWYEGASLIHNLIDPRFPVQWVTRPQTAELPDYRGYAGRIDGGVFRPGDEVLVLPSGLTTKVAGIDTFEGSVDEAFASQSVTIRLADDIDISRGDMICRPHNRPTVGQDLDAMVCWMTDRPLKVGDFVALKHTTRWVRAVVRDLHYRLDVNTLHRDESAVSLGLNDVGRLSLRVTKPLFYDSYRRNRQTGSFILALEDTNITAGAGMLHGPD